MKDSKLYHGINSINFSEKYLSSVLIKINNVYAT